MVPLHNETAFLQRVAAGDENAFTQLFHMHWNQVYGTSLHLTKSHDTACDLSQEIFIRLWENRHKLPDVRNIAAYIYSVSRHLIIDYWRNQVFSESNLDSLILFFADTGQNPQEQLELRELQEVLDTAIGRLQGKVKEVFLLSRKDGLNHEQIAARLGISVTSSKTYVVRALREIREFMAASTHRTGILLPAILILSGLPEKF